MLQVFAAIHEGFVVSVQVVDQFFDEQQIIGLEWRQLPGPVVSLCGASYLLNICAIFLICLAALVMRFIVLCKAEARQPLKRLIVNANCAFLFSGRRGWRHVCATRLLHGPIVCLVLL